MAETGANASGVAEGRKDRTLKTIAISCVQFLGYENLKEKQLEVVVREWHFCGVAYQLLQVIDIYYYPIVFW